MKDRLPTKPGRVLITPEDGSAPYYAVMTRADEPTEDGTPLSKASLLKDTTAAAVGLTSDAVPDEVLAALAAKKVNKAGDTMTGDLTIRKSYPGVKLAPTADGSNSIVMDAIDQAMLQSRNAASDANRRGLLVRNSAKSASVAGALVLMDVVDRAYTYYDVLHRGNFAASSWQLIYTASPSGTEKKTVTENDKDMTISLLQASDLESIIQNSDYMDVRIEVAATIQQIDDKDDDDYGGSVSLTIGACEGFGTVGVEENGIASGAMSGTQYLRCSGAKEDGTRMFVSTLTDLTTPSLRGFNFPGTGILASLDTWRVTYCKYQATVKVYAR